MKLRTIAATLSILTVVAVIGAAVFSKIASVQAERAAEVSNALRAQQLAQDRAYRDQRRMILAMEVAAEAQQALAYAQQQAYRQTILQSFQNQQNAQTRAFNQYWADQRAAQQRDAELAVAQEQEANQQAYRQAIIRRMEEKSLNEALAPIRW